jgi:hypothetical protein
MVWPLKYFLKAGSALTPNANKNKKEMRRIFFISEALYKG